MILYGQELRFENLISLRKKLPQKDLNSELAKLHQFLIDNGAKKSGPIITATFNIEQAIDPIMDMEILIPIDKQIEGQDKYKFKKELLLTNAVKATHKGNPSTLQNTYNEINMFIQQNNLQPITSAYSVTIKDVKDISEIDNFEMNIYVGINPNKL